MTLSEFKSLPIQAQNAIFALECSVQEEDGTDIDGLQGIEGEQDVDLSEFDDFPIPQSQALDVLNSLRPETKQLVRFIVASTENVFDLNNAAARAKVAPGKLGGRWTGLTKVTRRVSGNKDLRVISWSQNDDGSWQGSMDTKWWTAFRKAFGLT